MAESYLIDSKIVEYSSWIGIESLDRGHAPENSLRQPKVKE